jgi:hypothetical protein
MPHGRSRNHQPCPVARIQAWLTAAGRSVAQGLYYLREEKRARKGRAASTERETGVAIENWPQGHGPIWVCFHELGRVEQEAEDLSGHFLHDWRFSRLFGESGGSRVQQTGGVGTELRHGQNPDRRK